MEDPNGQIPLWPQRGDLVVSYDLVVRVVERYRNGMIRVQGVMPDDDDLSQWDLNPGEFRDIDRILQREQE